MFNNNADKNRVNVVQNQFTAYVKNAIHNSRIDHLYKRINPAKFTGQFEDLETVSANHTDFANRLAEYDALQWALRMIKERERYILLARVIDEKDFDEIGAEIGLSYKGAAAVYYRTLAKLRKLIGGDGDGF